MECRTSQTLIHESFERTLSSVEQTQLDAHLAGCPSCQADAVLIRTVVQAVEGMPNVQPAGDFTLKVMDRLPAPVGGFLGIPSIILRGVAATVAVVAAVLGWIYQDALLRLAQQAPTAAASSTDSISPYLEQMTAGFYQGWAIVAAYLPQVDLERFSPVASVLIAIGVAHVIIKMVYGFESDMDEIEMVN